MYLDESIPSSRYNDRIRRVRRKADTTNPFTMSLFSNREFAITKSIPEFDGFISTTTDYLSVVGTERDGENITCMTDETASGFTGVEIPET